MNQKTVYGEDDDQKSKQLAIEPQSALKVSKYPTPLDFIKLVQNDQEFQNRFCYCHRNDEYYDFRIVAFEVIDEEKKSKKTDKQEYMTVSANGIVHYINGETTFLTIPEWEWEMRLYQKIKKIKFF